MPAGLRGRAKIKEINMELIGKQIAIETILGQPPELHYPSWYAAQIEKLPPAPPEYLAEQAGILVTDTDTISRQAAIDEIKEIYEWHDNVTKERIIEHFKQLPSAQPEIIRCKDCKHWDGVDTCDVIDAPVWDNDFCSLAERRSDE